MHFGGRRKKVIKNGSFYNRFFEGVELAFGTMKASYEILRSAVSKEGAKAVAAGMGVSPSLVYKWCEPSEGAVASGTGNPLDRILRLCELTKEDSLLDWLCEQRGSFRADNPNIKEVNPSVLENTQTILREFSELLEAVTESYAHQQRIDPEEAMRIRKEWEDLKRVAEGFVFSCEAGVFDEQKEEK